MKPILAASLLALTIAAPVAAQSGAPGGFRLPPNPTPTSTPDIQGPVDPDAPIATRPRTPTPTPTPAPRPTATATGTPTATPVPATARETARPPAASPAARPAPGQPLPSAADVPTSESTTDAAPTGAPFALPTATAPAPTASPAPIEDEGGFPWLWTLLGLLALAAGAAAFVFVRRKREELAPTPVIEPPLARRLAASVAAPAAPALGNPAALSPLVPLMVEAQALKLSRSLMFATLSYELRLTNHGPTPLADIRLGADLVTAHGRVPVDQQLADPAQPLEIVQRVASLAPGESTVLSGELRLPVQHIRPIPQGRAMLYVPLLRLRIEAEGLIPFARTFVVGQRSAAPGGKLQPFRLDETPRTYRGIAQRALD